MDISIKLGFMFFISISLIGLFLVSQAYSKGINIKEQNQIALEEKAKTEDEIAELERDMEYTGTDEFVEKIARDKLGYIKDDEFIFVEK